ncbi:TrmH family RNA methyltransferase [Necropsobacter massiliensis]|uniref:TrmH family RNA methyltransferase n=1 Tax=Necropsobacter massiliensis TaxID=1400001 RepID=UPI000595BB78|nr:TrmH family RNA methyltransferase [Necropsobacter massiliensis]
MNAKKPTFQPAEHSNRFNQRTLAQKERAKKPGQTRPHFERARTSDKPAFKRDKNTARATASTPWDTARTPSQFTEMQMENARGTGNVKVTLKSAGTLGYEKKTGPLSPRAPEKIKKNRAEETKVYGENACLALFAERPESIVRVWTTVELAHRVGELFSYLASNKKAYHVVDGRELERVSGTEHHGGICMLVKKKRPFTLTGYLSLARQRDCIVLLDGIGNAHNLGAIIRSCAFYGVKSVVTADPDALNAASAVRVAEGGMEYIHPLQTDSTESALSLLRQAGYQVICPTCAKRGKSAAALPLADKVVFLLSDGGAEQLLQEKDDILNLSRTNPLKSGLNVAVVAGIVLAKWAEQSHYS